MDGGHGTAQVGGEPAASGDEDPLPATRTYAGARPRTSDGDLLAALLVRARTGDPRAERAIVDRCTPMVRAVARRYVSNEADVDDVVQDVWLALAENADRISSPAALRAWLVRVTTRASWRLVRRRSRAVPLADVGDRPAVEDTEALGTARAHRAQVATALDSALGRLRDGDRRLLEMLSAHDRPDYRGIGSALGRPVGSIGPTRQRALSRLRRDDTLRSFYV